MAFFNDFEGSFTKDALNFSFIDMEDAHLIDEKFATIINSDPDDFSKIRIEEFDPDVTWDASEGVVEAIELEIEEILNDQDEEIFNESDILDEIIKEEENCEIIQESLSEFLTFKEIPKNSKGPKPFSCSVCNMSTKSRYYFQQHFQSTKHQKRVLQSQIINNQGIIIEVIEDFDVAKAFKCDDCGKLYKNKKQLDDHIGKIHLILKCEKCNRRFRTEKEFNLHKTRHSKSSDFKCNQCHKKFTNNQNLKRHERTHTEMKRYFCGICEKNFGQKTNLFRHLKTHKS